ncbi:MAG: ABC transporter ATP-binding protein [Candidatus Parvarchaeota archaeon]
MTKIFKKNPRQSITAVDRVTLSVQEEENIGIIGESGSGKTTLGKIMVGLLAPDSGRIIYMNEDVTKGNGRKLKTFRKEVQMIFQDPYSSLDPKMTVHHLLSDFMRINGKKPTQESLSKFLEMVSLDESLLDKYPSNLSGGQRQRVAIARVLTLQPKLVIADEPVSSLDVSVRSQILQLLNDLRLNSHITFVYITHDISSLPFVAERVIVMYRGSIVEISEIKKIITDPLHPYTKGLLAAVPDYGKDLTKVGEHIIQTADIDDVSLGGCKFYSRCAYSMERCKTTEPLLKVVEGGRQVACHLYD